MSLKRTPTDEEIDALAEQFRQLWRRGDVVRPWFRQHREMLLGLVHGDWSWASVGRALSKAGITYRTGTPWTAKWLRSDFSRAQTPLKGYARRGRKPVPRHEGQAANISPPPVGPTPAQETWSEPAALPEEPEFQPARFIDWDAKRSGGQMPPAPAPITPIIQPPVPAYDDVIARLLGKKPPP